MNLADASQISTTIHTSCILSKALAWSSVSIDGDKPP